MNNLVNIKTRYVSHEDRVFWFYLDKHLSTSEFEKKIRYKQGYVMLQNDRPIGILKYNLFWDNIPFCTILYIDKDYQKNGFGRMLMNYWENEMRSIGYDTVLVSTQSNEDAQDFYRSIGYSDCGSLLLPDQPEELFLSKRL